MSGIFTEIKIYERIQRDRGNNATERTQTNRGNNTTEREEREERDNFNAFKNQVLASRGSRARTKGNAVTPLSEGVNFNPYLWESDKESKKESNKKLGTDIFDHYTKKTLEDIKKENKSTRDLDINRVHTKIPTTLPSMPWYLRLFAIAFCGIILALLSLLATLANVGIRLLNAVRTPKIQLFPNFIKEFFKALSFSTLDKGNPPFPSPFQFNDKTTIMEMGTPVYCKNPFTGSFAIEPLFKQALDMMKENKENWLYVNYLENNFKERKMVAALKQLGETQENFFYIQMPPKAGIEKLCGKTGTIQEESLLKAIIDNKHYHISEKVWNELSGNTKTTKTTKTKKENILKNILNSMGVDDETQLTHEQVIQFNSLLIDEIRVAVNPAQMNFTCKDGIDRGHAGKLAYLAFTQDTPIEDIKKYIHTRARIVKGRDGNKNLGEFFDKTIEYAVIIKTSENAIEKLKNAKQEYKKDKNNNNKQQFKEAATELFTFISNTLKSSIPLPPRILEVLPRSSLTIKGLKALKEELETNPDRILTILDNKETFSQWKKEKGFKHSSMPPLLPPLENNKLAFSEGKNPTEIKGTVTTPQPTQASLTRAPQNK